MARIPMTGGFSIIPEGVHVLKIVEAEYDVDFGKATFKLVNEKGASCFERFSLLDQDGKPNEKALNAFSFFAKTVMNDFDMEDVDPEELSEELWAPEKPRSLRLLGFLTVLLLIAAVLGWLVLKERGLLP